MGTSTINGSLSMLVGAKVKFSGTVFVYGNVTVQDTSDKITVTNGTVVTIATTNFQPNIVTSSSTVYLYNFAGTSIETQDSTLYFYISKTLSSLMLRVNLCNFNRIT